MSDLRDVRQAEDDECRADALIARFASEQSGVVARRQLLAAGIGREAIAHRIRTGRLHLIHRGVYAVGHTALSYRSHLMAAVLASGPGAAIAGGSAAALWELRDRFPSMIELTAPTAHRPLPGLRRRRIVLPADERTTRLGIPVTTVARTLLDRAGVLDAHTLARECEEAEKRRYRSAAVLGTLIERYPRAPGRAKLIALCADDLASRNATKQELERRFLALVERAGLPRPLVNARIEGYEVDAVWPHARVAVELDSRRHHDTARAFDRDRAKWRRLTVAGWHAVPVTWRHVTRDADLLVADLRALTAAPGAG